MAGKIIAQHIHHDVVVCGTDEPSCFKLVILEVKQTVRQYEMHQEIQVEHNTHEFEQLITLN